MAPTDVSRMTVADLRVELKRLGLPQAGKKADLIKRLAAAEAEAKVEGKVDDANVAEIHDAPSREASAEPQPGISLQHGLITHHHAHPSPDSSPKATTQAEKSPLLPHESPVPIGNGDQSDPPERADPEPLTVIQKSPSPIQEISSGLKINEVVDDGQDAPAVPELVNDVQSRKRRSRSPPQFDDEIARKRARQNEDYVEGDQNLNEISSPGHETAALFEDLKDVSYAIIQSEESPAVEDKDVEPAVHPATSAIYIKNFMRPLKENVLKDYLVELATSAGSALDPEAVQEQYLDQIRTHAYVKFRSIACASRARAGLHGKIWPPERNRRELWVDFIPPDKVREWSATELAEGGRGSLGRWDVRYEPDTEGRVRARLFNAETEPSRHVSAKPQPSAPAAVIPSGPARQFPGVEGAPLGPRGRGNYRQAPFPIGDGDHIITKVQPPLAYKPVPQELARRRLDNMRSYYTRDRHRDMGRPDEINRYTFEDVDAFVDRGKEVFVGIRPPHRDAERRRGNFGGADRGRPRGPPPPPFRPRNDRFDNNRPALRT
ncbi:hypothetical protein B0T24DRAFT_646927 [Lasiosphaeria ovina]|uniref:SAP domain-containing protein n=1 Tax=Lasiosphaeria ovina TaxID=92902 RepID=A0AAE0NDB6_9PEZI|nr:hypothetical protein B0T24DRAFT_646927 [Lasiosphaeria ovina]